MILSFLSISQKCGSDFEINSEIYLAFLENDCLSQNPSSISETGLKAGPKWAFKLTTDFPTERGSGDRGFRGQKGGVGAGGPGGLKNCDFFIFFDNFLYFL